MAANISIMELLAAENDWLESAPREYLDEIMEALALRNDLAALDLLLNRRPELLPVDSSLNVHRGKGNEEDGLSYQERLLNEVHDLFCKGDCYASAKSDLRKQTSQASIIATVTTAVSPYVGQMAPLLVAPVVVILSIIGRVGLTAWCKQQSARRARSARDH